MVKGVHFLFSFWKTRSSFFDTRVKINSIIINLTLRGLTINHISLLLVMKCTSWPHTTPPHCTNNTMQEFWFFFLPTFTASFHNTAPNPALSALYGRIPYHDNTHYAAEHHMRISQWPFSTTLAAPNQIPFCPWGSGFFWAWPNHPPQHTVMPRHTN